LNVVIKGIAAPIPGGWQPVLWQCIATKPKSATENRYNKNDTEIEMMRYVKFRKL